MKVNPLASFDAIALLNSTQKQLNNASRTEIQLLSYLACLLSIYKNQPVSDWGYDFYCTHGYPFSKELDDALEVLTLLGVISKEGDFFHANRLTKEKFNDFFQLSKNKKRMPFLDAVCGAVLSLPIGTIREALMNEPAFFDKKRAGGPREIFDNGGLENLYEQFSVLSETVGIHVPDLMVPAVIWISYLATINE